MIMTQPYSYCPILSVDIVMFYIKIKEGIDIGKSKNILEKFNIQRYDLFSKTEPTSTAPKSLKKFTM